VRKTVSILFALVLALGLCLMMALPAMAGAITSIDVTPVDATAGVATDYSLGFTVATGEATNVEVDFSAFGVTGNDMVLGGVSTNIADYTFGGFTVDPTGVTVNDTTKKVTFTGGTTTGAGAHTIDNAAPGTGLVITNDQNAGTHNVVINTTSDTGSFALTINPAAAHHLKVTGTATMNAGANNELTVTAYDQYDNVCSSGPNNYTGGKTITFSGPAASPDGNTPTVEGTDVGTVTAVNFTNGVSDAGAATLVAYKAEVTTVDADDGAGVDSTGNVAWDLDLTVVHGNTANLRVTGTATMVAGTNNELTVTACDQYGNVADGANGGTAYAGGKNLTFAGPGIAPDGTPPTVEGVNIGTATAVNFTAGVSDAGAATLVAYKIEITTVDVSDGAIDSTGNVAWDLDLTVTGGAIDHYAVSAVAPIVSATVPFTVIIQAQDVYNNNITVGGDATENITITLGIADAGATPTTTATAAGVAAVSMTMTVPQTFGQSITFTGVTSGKTGTSNTFDVATAPVGGAAPSPSGSGSVSISYFLDSQGRTTVVITLTSTNGLVTINVPSGTLVLDAHGNPLANIQIVVLSTPPPPPGYVLVGHAYDCRPDGATFQPAMTLTFKYYEASLPPGASEQDLVLAYWDGEQWVNLPTTIDATANTATAQVTHFTPFALIAPVLAAEAPPGETPQEAPPAEASPAAGPLNVWLVIGIIAAIIVAVLLAVMLGRGRRRARRA
jgi:hypothetical protein